MPVLGVSEALKAVDSELRQGPDAGVGLSKAERARLSADAEFESFQDGFGDAESLARIVRSWRRERLTTPAGEVSPFAPGEQAFHRAITELAYVMASASEDVQSFRSEVLGGSVLTLAELVPWIETRRTSEGAPYTENFLQFPGSEKDAGWVRSLPVTRGKTLDALRRLTIELAENYNWQPAQATAFVLCDAVPVVSVLSVKAEHGSSPGPGYISLRVSLELQPETVARAYAQARNRMASTERYRPLGANVWRAVEQAATGRATSEHYGSRKAFSNAVRRGTRRLGVPFEP